MNEKIAATQTLLESLQSRYFSPHCTFLLLTNSEANLSDIETNANIVAKKTEELHHVCEGLVSEEVCN
jgi:hypothetical protein